MREMACDKMRENDDVILSTQRQDLKKVMKVMTLSIEEVFIKKVGLEVCNHPKVKSVVVRKQGLYIKATA